MSVEISLHRDYVQREMLEDRSYMRQSPLSGGWSATMALLVANVAAFILESLCYGWSGWSVRIGPNDHLALSVAGLEHGYVWQLVTYQFMHGGILHLLMNCLSIYVFGREVEAALGRKSFLTLYFSSGLIGGLCQAAMGKVLAEVFGNLNFLGPTVGASAGAFGLVAAFAMLYPEEGLLTPLYFIIPVPLRAKYLLLFEGIMAVAGVVIGIWHPGDGSSPNIANAAHLGGMLTGIFFIRFAIHWNWNWRWPQFRSMRKPPPRRLIRIPAKRAAEWDRSGIPAAEDMPADEFLSREVDPILDKISAQGIQSLTERERRVLEAAREKMAKR
jgi:membrane associated rhomboid family serine protease